ncbi:MAG: flagellar protein FlgN [Deltaproteobacteria bacterium]|nr:flagellar protein FlgN [Deltaproteobacteria bacterium]
MTHTVHEKLQSLYDVILVERESTKALDLEALQEATLLKEELLAQLDLEDELSQEDRKLAETIRFENRRNAYLLWAALNWIRESMEFFGRKSAPDSYNPTGTLVLNKNGGHLLSGRV